MLLKPLGSQKRYTLENYSTRKYNPWSFSVKPLRNT